MVKGDSVIVEGENQRLMRHSTAVKKLPESRTPPRDPPDQRDGQEHADAEYSRKEALRRVWRKPDYYIQVGEECSDCSLAPQDSVYAPMDTCKKTHVNFILLAQVV